MKEITNQSHIRQIVRLQGPHVYILNANDLRVESLHCLIDFLKSNVVTGNNVSSKLNSEFNRLVSVHNYLFMIISCIAK